MDQDEDHVDSTVDGGEMLLRETVSRSKHHLSQLEMDSAPQLYKLFIVL